MTSSSILQPYQSQWSSFITAFPRRPGETDYVYARRLVGYAHGRTLSSSYTREQTRDISECMVNILTLSHESVNLTPFYFTFGPSHRGPQGQSLYTRYTTIHAPSESIARTLMFAARRDLWSTSHTDLSLLTRMTHIPFSDVILLNQPTHMV